MDPTSAITHIDSSGSLRDPAILLATVVSSALLAFLTIKALILWARMRNDLRARILLALFLSIAFFGVAIFQIEFAAMLYRELHKISPAVELGLSVPVFPVWLVAVLSGGVSVLVRSAKKSAI